MNGPADSEVDYKKKYRNLKRKLKFLIYVSAGVAGLVGGEAWRSQDLRVPAGPERGGLSSASGPLDRPRSAQRAPWL